MTLQIRIVYSLVHSVLSGEGKMIVTEVGINTINGDTLVKMQTLEPPKTALQIAIDRLCGVISTYGTLTAGFYVYCAINNWNHRSWV